MTASAAAQKRIMVVCQLDGFANGIKPVEIARYLRARGHDVRLVDTYHLSRASSRRGTLRSRLPRPRPQHSALYAVEAATRLTRGSDLLRRRLSYHLLLAEHRLRRRILRTSLRLHGVDLLICETPYDAGVLLDAGPVRTLYDCPTPWADELFFEGRLTPGQHLRLRRLEADLFEAVDHLSFHWESYGRYAVEHYRISGDNLVTLNVGCAPVAYRARYATPARIAYLGSLSSRFVDLPLLARLSRAYPRIDVYGGPEPNPALGLRYKGYAAPDVLRDYQFGLITCTDDALRRDGFSAKHLQYIAAGLPVLVPAWRRSAQDLAGSLPYEESTFASVVASHSEEHAWRQASDDAYAQAQQLTWDTTLRPLQFLLAGVRDSPAREPAPVPPVSPAGTAPS